MRDKASLDFSDDYNKQLKMQRFSVVGAGQKVGGALAAASTDVDLRGDVNTASIYCAVSPQSFSKESFAVQQADIKENPIALPINFNAARISPFGLVDFNQSSVLPMMKPMHLSKKEIENAHLNDKIRWSLLNLVRITPQNIDNSIQNYDVSAHDDNILSTFLCEIKIMKAAKRIQSIVGMPLFAIILAMLGAVNIASWGRYVIPIRSNWSEALVDYIIITAKSGSRKSALGTILRSPFDDFSAESLAGSDSLEIQELLKASHLLVQKRRKLRVGQLAMANAHAEELMRELKEHAQESAAWTRYASPHTRVPRIFVSASTQVALIRTMVDGSGCIAILATEGDFLKSDALLGKGSPVAFLKGHTMETLSYDSGKQGMLIVQNPALPQLHLIQPDVLASLTSKKYLKKNGVLPRFQVYVCPDSMRSNPAEIDEAGDAALREFQSVIKSIISENYTHISPRSVTLLALSYEAKRRIEEFEKEMMVAADRAENDDLRAFISKSAGQAVRFAGDLHLLAHPCAPSSAAIEGGTMQAAITLCRMLLPHAEAIYSQHGLIARENARRILRWITDWREKAGRFTRSNLFSPDNTQWHQFTAREVQQGVAELKSDHSLVLAALGVLEQHGWLAQIPMGKNGRLCVLNPRAWGSI